MNFSSFFSYCPVCGSKEFSQNNQKSKKCNHCGFVYYMNPSAAVAGFIVNEAGDLLVCRRGKEPAKDTLDLPGGFTDENETAEEAITREIAEELNARVTQTNYLFSLPNEYEYSGLTIPTMDLFFACQLENTDNLQPADDVADCFFVPLKELQPEFFGLRSIRQAVALFLEKEKERLVNN
jgi:NAD+ diphosphatase